MRKAPGIFVALIALAAAALPRAAASLDYRSEPVAEYAESQIGSAHRWLRSPIILSFSTSLQSPPENIKKDSDVIGALRRALESWAAAANVQFLETSSANETVSRANDADGVNLITISRANAGLFGSSERPAQTRVFQDSGGAIVEADIALNPNVQFSSDRAAGTYDLESTFAHEIGHLLGLEHSAIIGATMQPRQAKNGVYGLPAITQRSLSADDEARARNLYGPRAGVSSIGGRLSTNTSGHARAIFGAHIFAEEVATGRVMAGSITTAAGTYRLAGLPPGVYRVFGQSLDGPVKALDIGREVYSALPETSPAFRSFIGSTTTPSQSLNLSANSAFRLSFFVFLNPVPAIVPRLIGMNGELSTSALPLVPGQTFTILVAGENVDQISGEGISVSSPLIRVDASSLKLEAFAAPYPVISFEVKVEGNIQPGDYTIRLQGPDGELAYLPGAISLESK